MSESPPASCQNPSKADLFTRFAQWCAKASGSPMAFGCSVLIILLWAFTGPLFAFSDTWQLVINTGTTIITFLMVFVIQNTQNRDTTALHLKIDELLRATDGAHNVLMDLENLSAKELNEVHEHYSRLAEVARKRLRKGGDDTARMLDSEDEQDTKPRV